MNQVIDQIKQLKDLIGLTEKDIEDRKNIVENLQSVFENRIAGKCSPIAYHISSFINVTLPDPNLLGGHELILYYVTA